MRCGLNKFSIPEGLIIGLTDRLRYSSFKTLARFAGVPRRKGKTEFIQRGQFDKTQ